jgi:signal transduction histidine kinase
MPGTIDQRRHAQVVKAVRTAAVVLLVGAIIVLLLRRLEVLPPISPLGGVAMALSATALLGVTRGHHGGGRIAAVLLCVIAALTIVAGIRPDALPAGSRLGWASATVIVTAAISMLVATFARPPAHLVALGVGGFVLAAVGAVSLLIRLTGYLDNLSGRGFEGITLLLAGGALVLGLAMLALGWTDVSSTVAIPPWAPLAAATGGVIGSLLLWRTLALNEEFAIGARTEQAASERARAIEREVSGIGRVLLQFAMYHDGDDPDPVTALTILRRDVEGVAMVALIDSVGLPSLVIPARADASAIAATVPVRAVPTPGGRSPVAALEIPSDTARMVLHAAPCTARACPGGVATVIHLGTINQLVTGRRQVDWTYDIGPPRASRPTGDFRRTGVVRLGELDWIVTARPTASALARARSGLPEVVLLLGMVSTAFLVVAIRLGAAAWANARAVEGIRIATAITRATDAIWEWDAVRGTLRRSGELWRHLGYDPGRLQQTLVEWLDLVHPDERARVTGEFLLVEDGHRDSFDTEYRVRTSSGAWHTMVDRGRVIDRTDTNHPRRVMGITADVTASRLAERELRETEALSGIGRIAARVAHEINNPLAGIRSAFLLVKDAIPETHPHHRYVGAIEREVERIAAVTRNLYETYRPDDRERGASFATIANDAATLLGQVNKRANVAIEIRLDGVPSVVPLSAALLRQIVYNLVQNAVDASPTGGVIDLIGRTEGDELVIEVRDQGQGVPLELRDRIFEAFFTTKVEPGSSSGLGLGLSMVERSVAAAGGRIAVSDTPGGGATFTVHLPITSQGATT